MGAGGCWQALLGAMCMPCHSTGCFLACTLHLLLLLLLHLHLHGTSIQFNSIQSHLLAMMSAAPWATYPLRFILGGLWPRCGQTSN